MIWVRLRCPWVATSMPSKMLSEVVTIEVPSRRLTRASCSPTIPLCYRSHPWPINVSQRSALRLTVMMRLRCVEDLKASTRGQIWEAILSFWDSQPTRYFSSQPRSRMILRSSARTARLINLSSKSLQSILPKAMKTWSVTRSRSTFPRIRASLKTTPVLKRKQRTRHGPTTTLIPVANQRHYKNHLSQSSLLQTMMRRMKEASWDK